MLQSYINSLIKNRINMLALISCLFISLTFSFALTKVNITLDEVNKIQKYTWANQ